MLPFCRPAVRNLQQGEMAKVLIGCWKTRGVASLQSAEKMMRELSTAATTC